MEMPAFDQIILPHVILLVPDIIAAIAIIEAAVALIIVYTILGEAIPGEAILATDAAEATQDGDLVQMIHHSPSHLNDTTTGHNLHVDLTEDIDPTHISRSRSSRGRHSCHSHSKSSDHKCCRCASRSPRRSDSELIEAVYCSH